MEEEKIIRLLNARGLEFDRVCDFANELRKKVSGEEVTYAVNRNINYTNVCYFRCGFCAFSKGKMSENLRGKPYDLKLDEIVSEPGKPGIVVPAKSVSKEEFIPVTPGRPTCRFVKQSMKRFQGSTSMHFLPGS